MCQPHWCMGIIAMVLVISLCCLYECYLCKGRRYTATTGVRVKPPTAKWSRYSRLKQRMSQLLPGATPQLVLARKTRPPTQSILAPDNPHFPQSLASPLRP